jgi:hypothetical protein
MAGHADATGTFAHERNRLCGRQQRREAVLVLECLKRLPPLDPIVVRLRKQPLRAHEADVAPREHLDEAIVERRQRLVYLERQRGVHLGRQCCVRLVVRGLLRVSAQRGHRLGRRVEGGWTKRGRPGRGETLQPLCAPLQAAAADEACHGRTRRRHEPRSVDWASVLLLVGDGRHRRARRGGGLRAEARVGRVHALRVRRLRVHAYGGRARAGARRSTERGMSGGRVRRRTPRCARGQCVRSMRARNACAKEARSTALGHVPSSAQHCLKGGPQ